MTETTTLYKITKTGATRQWTVKLKDGAYRTIHGQKDSDNLVTSLWTQCQPKNVGRANATTAEQQAQAEVTALIKKKQENGYSTTAKRATASGKLERVMLAHKYDDYVEELKEELLFSQPKLDGIRGKGQADGLWSRTGKLFTSCPHIIESLRDFFATYPDVFLDGELYNHKLYDDFPAICSLIKRSKLSAEDLQRTKDNVLYYVYDCGGKLPDGTLLTSQLFADRHKFLQKHLADLSHVVLVNTETVKPEDTAHLDELFEDYLEQGFEGQMVRRNWPYEFGRSKSLLKRKTFEDGEYQVVDVLEGKGNRQGTVGRFVLKLNETDTFRSNYKANMAELKRAWENRQDWIGQMVTVRFLGFTPYNVPRCPYVVRRRDYE